MAMRWTTILEYSHVTVNRRSSLDTKEYILLSTVCIDGVVGKHVRLTGLILRQAGGPSSNLGQCTKWIFKSPLELGMLNHRL